MTKDSSSPSAPISEVASVRLDRRGFLRGASTCVGAMCAAVVTGCTIPVRSMRAPRGRIIELPIASYPELDRDGGRLRVVHPELGTLFVCRGQGDDQYLALSATCTHQGCTVSPSGRGFRCPCHGSRYDAVGRNRTGPAPRPLARFNVRRDGDVVLVDLGVRP